MDDGFLIKNTCSSLFQCTRYTFKRAADATSEYSKFISSSSLRLTKNIKTMAKLMRLFVVTSGPVQNGPGSFLCKFPKNVGGKEYY